MKALRNMLVVSFATLLAGLFTGCGYDTLTENPQPSAIKVREGGCTEITQTYVNGIKSLAAAELSASPGSIQVALAELTSPTSGQWYQPNTVVGREIEDGHENFMFVAFLSNPLTDAEVVAYYYDEDFCVTPSSGNVMVDDLNSILLATWSIVTDDFDGA